MAEKKFFWPNPNFLLLPELKSIVLKIKGENSDIKNQVRKLGDVKLAVLTGIFTRTSNPVDILLVGEMSQIKLNKFLKSLRQETGREINWSVLTEKEFKYRKNCHDRFISDVLAKPKIVLIDKLEILE